MVKKTFIKLFNWLTGSLKDSLKYFKLALPSLVLLKNSLLLFLKQFDNNTLRDLFVCLTDKFASFIKSTKLILERFFMNSVLLGMTRLYVDNLQTAQCLLKKIGSYILFFLKVFFTYALVNCILQLTISYYFSFSFGKYHTLFDISTFYNYSFFLRILNPDNAMMFFYLIFFRIGLFNYLNCNTGELYFKLGFNWIDWYVTYKKHSPDFCFFLHQIGFVKNHLLAYFDAGLFEYNSTPIFSFFGLLFASTVILSWIFFSYLGLYGIFRLNLITLFFFWVSLLLSAKSILVNQKVYIIRLSDWIFLTSNVKIDNYFLIDTISFCFMLLTTTIALFVFIYAFSYFRYEPLVDRFLLFTLSFVISMVFLVTSGNTIMLFLGWELIGITSFLLINFWTTKTATMKSSFKAFSFNKVSDLFMFLFLISSFSTFYTFDIFSINSQAFAYEPQTVYLFGTPVSFLEFLSIVVIGASFIKSAQIGGHAWLPDSMEAPVPASSLIHSATLVSAGIYLILRFNFIFDSTQYSKFIIPVVGSFTAAYGGVCAVFQSDIKKTLAYSTISHCGFLMVLCSTEMNEFAILYLYVHGFFKAGVFMCVGNVLRITRGYQDTRRMGGLLKYLPFEYFCCTIGIINLAGLPFTFGFFIKHLLLVSLGTHMYLYYFVIFNSLVGAFAGLFYSYRLLTFIFCDFKKANSTLYINSSKTNFNSKFYSNSSLAANLAITLLFISSYFITYFLFKYFLANNQLFSDFMNTTILTTYYSNLAPFDGFLLNFSFLNLAVIFILVSLFFSRFRKYTKTHHIFKLLCYLLLIVIFFVIFYTFI